MAAVRNLVFLLELALLSAPLYLLLFTRVSKEDNRVNLVYREFIPKDRYSVPRREIGEITVKYAPVYNHSCITRETTKWNVCDPTPCGDSVDKSEMIATYFANTSWGQNTGEYVNEVMRAAWGPNPPWIDLYVRAGCRGAGEMSNLLVSLEVFWPRFLGDILVVLDYGDADVLDFILPPKFRKHSYHIVYEHCPCMSGRVFNQYSYITLDRHTKAQYVVTLDSDCALHTPITPDVLFNNKGELKLAVATIFQKGLWERQQEIITGPGMSKYGHSMVTQPVAFITSTLPAFRDWVQRQRARCYEDLVDEAASDGWAGFFCWMCQLNIFVSHENVTGYDVHYVEHRKDVYVRYGVHTNYEIAPGKNFPQTTNHAVNSGLCMWFGESVFPSCKGFDLSYINFVLWTYAGSDISQNVTAIAREDSIKARQSRLGEIVSYLNTRREGSI
jgi:hypothetical protein